MFQLQLSQQDMALERDFGSALQQGLQERYRVFYGSAVDSALDRQFMEMDCAPQECAQNVALEFDAELVADASVSRLDSGYALRFVIQNVIRGDTIEARTHVCENCSQGDVINALIDLGARREVGGGAVASSSLEDGRVEEHSGSEISDGSGAPAIVLFDTSPSNARVIINGEDAGVTPYQGLTHFVGEQLDIRIERQFYQPYEFSLTPSQPMLELQQPIELKRGVSEVVVSVEPLRRDIAISWEGQETGQSDRAPAVLTLASGIYAFNIRNPETGALVATRRVDLSHGQNDPVIISLSDSNIELPARSEPAASRERTEPSADERGGLLTRWALGYHFSDVYLDYDGGTAESEPTGLTTNFMVGIYTSPWTSVSFQRMANWWSLDGDTDAVIVSGFTGGVGTLYFSSSAPSLFVETGFGFGDISVTSAGEMGEYGWANFFWPMSDVAVMGLPAISAGIGVESFAGLTVGFHLTTMFFDVENDSSFGDYVEASSYSAQIGVQF